MKLKSLPYRKINCPNIILFRVLNQEVWEVETWDQDLREEKGKKWNYKLLTWVSEILSRIYIGDKQRVLQRIKSHISRNLKVKTKSNPIIIIGVEEGWWDFWGNFFHMKTLPIKLGNFFYNSRTNETNQDLP